MSICGYYAIDPKSNVVASLTSVTASLFILTVVTALLFILTVVTALFEIVVAPSATDVTSPEWLGCV
jgi:hypothetical protein